MNSNLESPHYAVFPQLIDSSATKEKETYFACAHMTSGWETASTVAQQGVRLRHLERRFFLIAFNAAIAVSYIETCRLTSKSSKSYPSSHETD